MKTTQSQNILIGVLMMSALILGMLLLFVQPKAEANMISQTGDMIMITQGGGNGGDETLTVIDARNGKMITYYYNGQKNRFNVVAGSNLRAP